MFCIKLIHKNSHRCPNRAAKRIFVEPSWPFSVWSVWWHCQNWFQQKFYSDRIPRLWKKIPRGTLVFYPLDFVRILISLKLNKSIYQNLVETTFDTNNYCRFTLVSWLVRVRDVIPFFFFFFFLSLSVSLSTSFVPTRSAYLQSFWYSSDRRTEGGRFSAGLTEASYLAVLLSAKHFFVFLMYVMALPNMSCGYWFLV
jgi:hypothetical protein